MMEILQLCRSSVVLVCVFLCVSSISTTEGGDSRVVYVMEGAPFELTCQLTVFEWAKWQRDGRDITSESDSPTDYITDVRKTQGSQITRLFVRQAKADHAGYYRCTAFRKDSHHVIVVSAASLQPNYDRDQTKIMHYHKNLVLQCNITGAQESDFIIKWSKDGKPLPTDDSRLDIKESERKLVVHKTVEEDVGTYTCEAFSAKSNTSETKADIEVIGKPLVTLPSELSVVEGMVLRIECNVLSYPPAEVKWIIGPNATELTSSTGRYVLESHKNVSNALLIIREALMSDRTSYNCTAVNSASPGGKPSYAVTNVRVKDKLAALWPFLGICAEVIVLCTIILIYEKKRNKAELDESDTDQSPEQKNTPDHGKDVRQRK